METEVKGAREGDLLPHLRAEATQVWKLYEGGIIREVYFDDARRRAVLILECENVGAARQVLSTLPLVRAGLIDFELLPLGPYSGFARLFAEKP
jgi:hypothetical protein